MEKRKVEFILVIIATVILAYVGWQAYNTYLRSPKTDLSELETGISLPDEAMEVVAQVSVAAARQEDQQKEQLTGKAKQLSLIENKIKGAEPPKKTKRNPFRHSLPTKLKEQPPSETKLSIKDRAKKILKTRTKDKTEKEIEKEKPAAPIVLPQFTITGIVWGKYQPRVIIDNNVYKIGDMVKGARISVISKKGIQLLYKNKEFWVTMIRN